MPQPQRFLLVEGIRDEQGRGIPVTDPHNPLANPARYAGWKPSAKPNPDALGVIDHYELDLQVLADHIDLRRAITAGELKLHGETIARTHDEARTKLAAKPAKDGDL